jgi:hypothetical protein
MKISPTCDATYPDEATTRIKDGLPLARTGGAFPRTLKLLLSGLGLLIALAGIAFGTKAATIGKEADMLDKSKHYNLGGILREFACRRGGYSDCDRLGGMYLVGPPQGVNKDQLRAARLFTRACDGGFAYSCEALGAMYAEGWGVARNPRSAARYFSQEMSLFSKACDIGDATACGDLGSAYDEGYTVPKDFARSAQLYSKACSGGNLDACSSLALMYSEGRGVPKDYARADDLYSHNCFAGQASACSDWAWDLESGLGVNRDLSKAQSLYDKACSMGDSAGCEGSKAVSRKMFP